MIALFVLSFIYLILIVCVYFSKKTINNLDNKIYKVCLIINVFGVLLDILQYFLIYFSAPSLVITIVSKMFLAYIITWTSIFAIYVFSIRDNKLKCNFFMCSIYFISLVFSALLPIDYYHSGRIMYTFGYAVSFVYFYVSLCIVCMIVSLVLGIVKKIILL